MIWLLGKDMWMLYWMNEGRVDGEKRQGDQCINHVGFRWKERRLVKTTNIELAAGTCDRIESSRGAFAAGSECIAIGVE
jgi:hypothetical protein